MTLLRGMRIFALVAALALAAAGASSAEPLKIRIGWVVVPQSLVPIFFDHPGLGKHLGQSYVLEPIHFNGSTPELPALATGDLDIATLAFSSFGLALQNAGLGDLRIISDELQDGAEGYYTNEYMVLKDSPVKTVEDLKGKILATNAIGGAADIAMRAVMHKHHLESPKDYTIIEVNFPNMKAVLLDHKADLISAVAPFSYDTGLLDKAHTLFTQKDGFGTTQLTFWTARTGFIAKNRAALVDFYEDALRSLRWYLDPANHREAIDIIARFTKAPPALFDGWAFTKKDYYRNRDGIPNLAALQQNLTTQKELGFLKADIDVQRYTDLSLVREAGKRLQ
ncbi:MAG TPA: ABC transporter substrate-binding protein [Stellaceae bacterium]|nr:ABC transporter substrate-binding protein [Stellaceae bacterium]